MEYFTATFGHDNDKNGFNISETSQSKRGERNGHEEYQVCQDLLYYI